MRRKKADRKSAGHGVRRKTENVTAGITKQAGGIAADDPAPVTGISTDNSSAPGRVTGNNPASAGGMRELRYRGGMLLCKWDPGNNAIEVARKKHRFLITLGPDGRYIIRKV